MSQADEDARPEAPDWGCIGCLVEEFILFPLALVAAAGIRTWLGWGPLAWRDVLLAILMVALFYIVAALVSATVRRRR